ncbi:uncharacterized protein JN550_007912 [Neoarthrinium moseri]|uniref:uncharacterized protein n=1 Tax=Neoarthrinium moseri TaxID=1658444 RepID=UPI001FDBFD98|nr:uncharacterized protein JN550_007912 [Neoarthrinium moseri]KAI1865934.1 hypothetical protein JN550_007912 [Neoarthrinium moseri]
MVSSRLGRPQVKNERPEEVNKRTMAHRPGSGRTHEMAWNLFKGGGLKVTPCGGINPPFAPDAPNQPKVRIARLQRDAPQVENERPKEVKKRTMARRPGNDHTQEIA